MKQILVEIKFNLTEAEINSPAYKELKEVINGGILKKELEEDTYGIDYKDLTVTLKES